MQVGFLLLVGAQVEVGVWEVNEAGWTVGEICR